MQVPLNQGVYTRMLNDQKAHIHLHALSCKEKHVRVGKLIFGPWYLVLGIWTYGFGPWYLVKSVDPRYWALGIVYYGFGPWYCGRPKTIKEEGDHVAKDHLNYY